MHAQRSPRGIATSSDVQFPTSSPATSKLSGINFNFFPIVIVRSSLTFPSHISERIFT
ncbi:hypothetical protein M404DRAFT_1003646 [Pisolithus tinctorius Marx 270]|uniref:Uncharacterized protein n=1 Tax=Pisolithus tinctorius Marx 270 TaxID=870435 RepID=A0A0C3NZD3_PISTI|nr:hypothetical protein M404DRAFT_1003646 [Pisolithus tinctorius Marx 270]